MTSHRNYSGEELERLMDEYYLRKLGSREEFIPAQPMLYEAYLRQGFKPLDAYREVENPSGKYSFYMKDKSYTVPEYLEYMYERGKITRGQINQFWRDVQIDSSYPEIWRMNGNRPYYETYFEGIERGYDPTELPYSNVFVNNGFIN